MINEPSTKDINEIAFNLNSDDYSSGNIHAISKWLKDNGYKYTYYRTYSKTKIMSWGCYRVKTDKNVSWEQNKGRAADIIEKALLSSVQSKLKNIGE